MTTLQPILENTLTTNRVSSRSSAARGVPANLWKEISFFSDMIGSTKRRNLSFGGSVHVTLPTFFRDVFQVGELGTGALPEEHLTRLKLYYNSFLVANVLIEHVVSFETVVQFHRLLALVEIPTVQTVFI